jgi:hypothetical protein
VNTTTEKKAAHTRRPTKAYIGDGVYVSIEWGNLKLETDRGGVTHWIVLEPQVYAALVDYVEREGR